MRACVRLTREIFAQAPFDAFRGREIQPGSAVQSDDEIDAFIRDKAEKLLHIFQRLTMIEVLVDFKEDSATASGRLETLTRWLIAFTCAVVLLTVVLVVHDLTR